MSNSYRIRTQVGVDKSIRVLLDQDFEYLEILSLKILQNQIYTRQCSDYGVVVGRVISNGGFGIPNAKVSIFIPLSREDQNNPIISELYPYKDVSDVNEDGYRYNLLPYVKSYSEHSPTGTFPTREDVLIDTSLIEVFDKYYRYTARTNESGDFMIFGVPVGQQTIHMDVDLSDIGEFSLSPQDLIRMDLANELQVSGTKFRTSSNLAELPQILSLNQIIQVEPLWGEPEVCNLGITRIDFDLTEQYNVNIMPTAIFMGSIISSNDDEFQKRNCKPKLKQGNLCSLVTGPGEILAIRQTVLVDENGRPGLETVDLDSGGRAIDDNGTWLIDVPMNLDYVTTNEFGERVLSLDPKVGIPTKAKYRFKVKWSQSPSLSETVKRAYFLVPNIREYGWTTSSPNSDPLKSLTSLPPYQLALKSYAFSLDWNDYADIQAAIDCEDTFYEMEYNKVYTVSQLITQYRKGTLPNRIITVKDILAEQCESENVKFPTNDAMFRFDIIFLLFLILMFPLRIVFYLLTIVLHVLAFLMKFIILPIFTVLITVVFLFIVGLCYFINGMISILNSVPYVSIDYKDCPNLSDYIELIGKLWQALDFFTLINIPNLTYPECILCSCKEGQSLNTSPSAPSPLSNPAINNTIQNSTMDLVLSEFTDVSFYNNTPPGYTSSQFQSVVKLMVGTSLTNATNISGPPTALAPQLGGYETNSIFTSSLTLAERINLFNTKAKYFENAADNPYGGVNQIKVSFEPNTIKYHTDNIVVISCKKTKLANFKTGQLITFQNIELSKDVNLKGAETNEYGTNAILGTPVGTIFGTEPNQMVYREVDIVYTTPANTTDVVTYAITGKTSDFTYAKFAMDIEYFQVITAMTYNNFNSQCVSQLPNNFRDRFLNNNMRFEVVNPTTKCYVQSISMNPLTSFLDYKDQVIVFLVRGVDPYSTRTPVSYDLSKIFGYNSWGNKLINGQYKLNHPIKGGFRAVDHNISSSSVGDTSYSNQHLYYESFLFQPSSAGTGSFSAFTSDLPKYYSSLGNNQTFFTPGAPAPLVSFVFDTTFDSLMINYPTNYIGQEKSVVVPPPYWSCNFLSSNTNNLVVENRGYYDRERVEGGSAMYQILTVDPSDPLKSTTYYYAPTYNSVSINYSLGSNGRQIIMRSDRLPTSTNPLQIGNNSFSLQNNLNLATYYVSDSGYTNNSAGVLITNPTSQLTSDDDPSDNTGQINALFDSLTCDGFVPLSCYYFDTSSNSFKVKPTSDGCYKNGVNGTNIIDKGCFVLVTVIFLSLFKDLKLVGEWATRMQISFAACRNVWSHIFTNNWINGTLYAFAIKNDRFFRIIGTQTTEPYSDYCKDTVILHPTNNFYYRSSPYDFTTKQFLGAPQAQGGDGNKRNLLFPTTIMDLGPRNLYIQEIVMSDDYDGYVVDKLNSTTYSDVSEILNYLILSRLVNSNVLQQLLGTNNAGIFTYFNSRSKNMVDGDYSQLISIQSETGVSPFEAANYPDSPSGQNPIFSNGNATDVVIGIFYSSETQTRDYISPRRTIIDPTEGPSSDCAFSYIKVFTQKVPFYQWEIKKNNDSDSIFGSQQNEWYTYPIFGNSFMSYNYQEMDRVNSSSRYVRPATTLQTQYFKGYIYVVDSSGNISASVSNQEGNAGQPRTVTVGAPQHFYFGLKKGKTAFDRFLTKWVNTEINIE